MSQCTSIASRLLRWHDTIDRDMPWKKTHDPYKIWLSEIILQQTRVAQGLPYYLRFVEAYPTVVDLAAAPLDDVLKLWQGLGYYSRARNMHQAAKTVMADFGAIFPDRYEDVLSLKGVGKYTAAAIMSFAYGASYPVVDGNVLRVIARLHGLLQAIDDKQTIDRVYSISESYISAADPARYNQAMMDLGALVCKPKNPDCSHCPFSDICIAKEKELVEQIPFKAKKIKKRIRHFYYLHILSADGYTLIHQRGANDIWQGLFDMPMLEKDTASEISEKLVLQYADQFVPTAQKSITFTSRSYKHILTHQTLYATFYRIEVDNIPDVSSPYRKIASSEMKHYAVPVLISKYMEDSTLRD